PKSILNGKSFNLHLLKKQKPLRNLRKTKRFNRPISHINPRELFLLSRSTQLAELELPSKTLLFANTPTRFCSALAPLMIVKKRKSPSQGNPYFEQQLIAMSVANV